MIHEMSEFVCFSGRNGYNAAYNNGYHPQAGRGGRGRPYRCMNFCH